MTDITRKQRDLALLAKQKPEPMGNLFPIICQKEWMTQALWNVLRNKGARTAGVDGKVKVDYYEARSATLKAEAVKLIEKVRLNLKEGNYQPKPAIRTYIPKANGKMRPLGIPTIKDRMVQEAIRMVIEPIYESEFLNCSYGFRPNRCTMDAISICRRYVQPRTKYYWVIEGDIRGCFDNIEHKILLKLIRKSIEDRRLVGTIHRFLKAGYQESGKIYKPTVGTPQGGVISPLLANIYLHQLDKWWSRNYDLDSKGKTARRREQKGNFILARYADDFIILSNGTEKATEAMKEEVALFLKEELKLELSQEKTAITHAFDGYDFLGFHIRKYRDSKGVIITPADANVQKIRDAIAERMNRRKHGIAVINMIRAMNPVVRGWANYYRYANSSKTFSSLDLYLGRKFLKWYRGRYQLPARKGTKQGLEWMDKKQPIHLYRFTEVKLGRYDWKRKSNPYIEMNVKKKLDHPFPKMNWYGNAERDADLRIECFRRDDGTCQICMRPKTNLITHHIVPISKGGEDTLDNLITLCEDCHKKYKLHYETLSREEIIQLGESRVR